MVSKNVTVNGTEPFHSQKSTKIDLKSPTKSSRVTFSETSDTIELDSLELEAELNEWHDSMDPIADTSFDTLDDPSPTIMARRMDQNEDFSAKSEPVTHKNFVFERVHVIQGSDCAVNSTNLKVGGVLFLDTKTK